MKPIRRIQRFFRRHSRPVQLFLLVLAVFAVYANGFNHAFQLDDYDYIVNNSRIQSLKNIPAFFTDPQTLSSDPRHADYRPLLQVSYALNYRLSGLDMWSWHLVQILLHGVVLLALYSFVSLLLTVFYRARKTGSIPFFVALVFAIHPLHSGVINYLSARSSLLTAAFLLPSLVLYMRKGLDDSSAIPGLAWLLYTLALFTKVEAVGALAVYYLWEFSQALNDDGPGYRFKINRSASGESATSFADRQIPGAEGKEGNALLFFAGLAKKTWPFLLSTAIYFAIRLVVIQEYMVEMRNGLNLSWLDYFSTQITAWWYYVINWFSPLSLVADHGAYPVYRSPLDWPVLLSLAGWIVVLGLALSFSGKRRFFLFVSVSALALISPTSSIFPLSEMVNEHRPYLPLALLSTTWLIPFLLRAKRRTKSLHVSRYLLWTGFALFLVILFCLTRQRNTVFHTDESYWRDVVEKAPACRSLANYGLVFLNQGRYEEALDYYLKSLEHCDSYYITHINLGIIYDQLGDDSRARHHYDLAVANDLLTGEGLRFRANYFLSREAYAEAIGDLTAALSLVLEPYSIYRDLAAAYAALGDAQQSFEYTRLCHRLDPQRIRFEIPALSNGFWRSPENYQAGIDYYQRIDQLLPDEWWVQENINRLSALKASRERTAVEP
ncbi:tetratricopeptide repeat protein [candidate division KSB1 bacterium]|nr:tetratricopeptide repeat protein [candidate division KSB1 bacterium]